VSIVIDPGHGGKDPGAVTKGNIYEKDMNLHRAFHTALMLSIIDDDIPVVLTRTKDVDLSLQERVLIASQNKAKFFVSIHHNAGGGTGFETFIRKNPTNEDRELQEMVHGSVKPLLSLFGIRDRGMKAGDYYVLNNAPCPALLVEFGFLDNDKDLNYLTDPVVMSFLCLAIASGLYSLYRNKS